MWNLEAVGASILVLLCCVSAMTPCVSPVQPVANVGMALAVLAASALAEGTLHLPPLPNCQPLVLRTSMPARSMYLPGSLSATDSNRLCRLEACSPARPFGLSCSSQLVHRLTVLSLGLSRVLAVCRRLVHPRPSPVPRSLSGCPVTRLLSWLSARWLLLGGVQGCARERQGGEHADHQVPVGRPGPHRSGRPHGGARRNK